MRFNIKKAALMGLVGFFLSIPAVILYALVLGEMLGLVSNNIDNFHYAVIALTFLFFVWGSQMASGVPSSPSFVMKESKISLRLFFWANGIVNVVFGAFMTASIIFLGVEGKITLVILAESIVSVVFGIGYIYFAIYLTKYLAPDKTSFLLGFIGVSFIFNILILTAGFVVQSYVNIYTPLISCFFTTYLWHSVRKLSGLSQWP